MGYEKCYVAFIDMLGFSEWVKTSGTTFEQVESALLYWKTEELCASSGLRLKYEIPPDDLKILCVSDNVVISIMQKTENALDAIIWICAAFQTALLLNAHILSRGGIAEGDFYMDVSEGMLFGPAYISAVQLEKKTEYPRVVLADEIDMNKITDKAFIQSLSNSSGVFVDYMEMAKRVSYASEKIRRTRAFIIDCLIKYKGKDERTYKKYKWVKDYFNGAIENDKAFCDYLIHMEDVENGQS